MVNDKPKLDIEEEIKSVLSPNSYIDPSEGIALCKHLNDVIEAEVEKAVINELKRLWNETQPDTIPQGVKPLDLNGQVILDRINQLEHICSKK